MRASASILRRAARGSCRWRCVSVSRIRLSIAIASHCHLQRYHRLGDDGCDAPSHAGGAALLFHAGIRAPDILIGCCEQVDAADEPGCNSQRPSEGPSAVVASCLRLGLLLLVGWGFCSCQWLMTGF